MSEGPIEEVLKASAAAILNARGVFRGAPNYAKHLSDMQLKALRAIEALKAERQLIRAVTIEECARQADACNEQDERDNGLAATGAARNAAEAIRALNTPASP